MRWYLVDKIGKINPWKSATGTKVVSFEEYSLKKRWDEKGIFPNTLLIESVLQLGAWLIIYSSEFKIQPLIVKIGKISFKHNARMGDVLDLEVKIISRNEDSVVMSGKVFLKGKLIVEGTQAVGVFNDLKDYQEPKTLKSLFGQIYRPR
jgi:3-hydroxyacyl-[acyl-carrier-protein] dehydratase